MRQPPYHLRPNKAVDRLTLIEAIKYIINLGVSLSDYTYYTLGGPHLEDCRLIYEFYPEIKMISVEENEDIFKRQDFHLPCGTLDIRQGQFKSFLTEYDPKDEKSIFWLDYTRFEPGNFEDFMVLLGKATPYSIIKVTMRAEPRDYFNKKWKVQEFQNRFGAYLPRPETRPPATGKGFAFLVQTMLRIASQKTLSSATPLTFQPISSFRYSDGTSMFSLTGIVCQRDQQGRVIEAFNRLQFSNLTWASPRLIDMPILSTKERLHLQRLLPCGPGAGAILRQSLGYLIDDDQESTEMKLQQYADFHRYYPYFMKATP
jgi:putative O-methyltransferase